MIYLQLKLTRLRLIFWHLNNHTFSYDFKNAYLVPVIIPGTIHWNKSCDLMRSQNFHTVLSFRIYPLGDNVRILHSVENSRQYMELPYNLVIFWEAKNITTFSKYIKKVSSIGIFKGFNGSSSYWRLFSTVCNNLILSLVDIF